MKSLLPILCFTLFWLSACSPSVEEAPRPAAEAPAMEVSTGATSARDADAPEPIDETESPPGVAGSADVSSFVLPDDACALIASSLLRETLGLEEDSIVDATPISNDGLYGCTYEVGGSFDSEKPPTMVTLLAIQGLAAKRQMLSGVAIQDGGDGCIFSGGGSSSQEAPEATPLPPEYAAMEVLPVVEVAELERKILLDKCGEGTGLFRSIVPIDGIGDLATYMVAMLGIHIPNLVIVEDDVRFTLQIVDPAAEDFDSEASFQQLVSLGQLALGEPVQALSVAIPSPYPPPTVEACHDPTAPLETYDWDLSDRIGDEARYSDVTAILGHPGEQIPGVERFKWVDGEDSYEATFRDGVLHGGVSETIVNDDGSISGTSHSDRFDRPMTLDEVREELGPESKTFSIEQWQWRFQDCTVATITFEDDAKTSFSAMRVDPDER